MTFNEPADPRDLRLLSRLSPFVDSSDLRGHFVLGAPPPLVPGGWSSRSVGAWTLATPPDLPALDVQDRDGATVGWVVGYPLDLERSQPLSHATVESPLDDRERSRAWIQRTLETTAGRFVILLVEAGLVSPDSVGSFPVLYDPARRAVASSPFLLRGRNEPIEDDELSDVFRTYETGRWLTLGVTALEGATRVVANHVLDLSGWRQERQWPRAALRPAPIEELAERVAVTVERTLAGAASAGELNISLTAGGDTRMMVACARPVLDRVHFFTVAQTDEMGRADTWLARKIASRFALDHRVLEWQEPSLDDVRRFMIRTGALIGEPRGRLAGPTYDLLGGSSPYVSGISVRASHGNREGDGPDTPLSATDLLDRWSLPRHPRLVASAAQWLDELPPLNAIDTLTLFASEMFLSTWGGALGSAYPDACTYTLYPFHHRAVMEAQLQLEPSDRGSWKTFKPAVVARRWPELLEFGMNHAPLGTRLKRRARSETALAHARAARAARAGRGLVARVRGRRASL
jgi:hypothetical protein